MSEYSQGPGYWQASDGRWYPPQPQPVAPPNQYGTSTPPSNQYGTPTPPPPSWGQQPAPGYGQPVFPGQMPGPMGFQPAPTSSGTNGLAVASLVLGILWLCGVGSLLAIVLGFVALGSIKRSGQSGKGLAIAGIVLGFLAVIATVVVLATTAIVFKHAGDSIGTATEKKDFALTSCTLDPTTGFATAEVTITNHSSKESGYWVEVNFIGSNGKVVDSAGGVAFATATVDPGQSSTIDVTGSKALTEAPRCAIGNFDRFAASTVTPVTQG